MRAWRSAALLVAFVACLLHGSATRGEAADKLDLNRASASELATLPGIGEAKARAIVDEREASPFRSVDDLLRVKGIGERLLDQLRDRVAVGEVATAGKPREAGAKSGGTSTAASAGQREVEARKGGS